MGMSAGMELGMNFINKGIDQFNYGVSQEYNRYAREKSRKWQMIDNQNSITYRVQDAIRNGIHPLAALGVNTASGVIGATGSQPPYGGGHPISGSRDADELTKANIRKVDAETELIKSSIPGQAPTHHESVGVNAESSPGITAGINPQMKYEKTPEGFFQLLPRDNEAYSDEAPITTQALFLFDDVARRKFGNTIKHNWSDPKLQYKKELWLKSRPPADHNGLIVLWNEPRGQWQQVPKTKSNAGHIWLNPKVYNPKGRKQRPTSYKNLPLS